MRARIYAKSWSRYIIETSLDCHSFYGWRICGIHKTEDDAIAACICWNNAIGDHRVVYNGQVIYPEK